MGRAERQRRSGPPLLDELGGLLEDRRGDRQPQFSGGFEVDHELEPLRPLEVRDHGALEAAFERAAAERVDGLFVLASPGLDASAPQVVELARRHRLPMISGQPEWVAAGGLMMYGPNIPSLFRRAAGYVDRILKGANPAELPVERPTTFDLVINLKTARELGLTIPPSVLQQATEVIQ